MHTTSSSEPAQPVKIVEDATCTDCGCMCDDITLRVEGDRIIEAQNACALGKTWFFAQHCNVSAACLIDGVPATVEEGIARTAQILTEARYPIIYGLCDTTSEAQRVAVAIADWIGGCVDTTTSLCHGPTGIAFQDVGEVTCTLGEIRNRGDLIVLWGTNPTANAAVSRSRGRISEPGGRWSSGRPRLRARPSSARDHDSSPVAAIPPDSSVANSAERFRSVTVAAGAGVTPSRAPFAS